MRPARGLIVTALAAVALTGGCRGKPAPSPAPQPAARDAAVAARPLASPPGPASSPTTTTRYRDVALVAGDRVLLTLAPPADAPASAPASPPKGAGPGSPAAAKAPATAVLGDLLRASRPPSVNRFAVWLRHGEPPTSLEGTWVVGHFAPGHALRGVRRHGADGTVTAVGQPREATSITASRYSVGAAGYTARLGLETKDGKWHRDERGSATADVVVALSDRGEVEAAAAGDRGASPGPAPGRRAAPPRPATGPGSGTPPAGARSLDDEWATGRRLMLGLRQAPCTIAQAAGQWQSLPVTHGRESIRCELKAGSFSCETMPTGSEPVRRLAGKLAIGAACDVTLTPAPGKNGPRAIMIQLRPDLGFGLAFTADDRGNLMGAVWRRAERTAVTAAQLAGRWDVYRHSSRPADHSVFTVAADGAIAVVSTAPPPPPRPRGAASQPGTTPSSQPGRAAAPPRAALSGAFLPRRPGATIEALELSRPAPPPGVRPR